MITLAAQFRPFVDPIPIYPYWPWLLLPLCLMFSIVYKAAKVEHLRELPRAALSGTLWILVGMSAAAIALAALVKVL